MFGLSPSVLALLAPLASIPLLAWVLVRGVKNSQGRRAGWSAALDAEVAQLGPSERAVLPATPCHLRKGIMTRPNLRAALTNARVLVRWSGSDEILLRDVREVSEATSFSGETRYGISWVVFRKNDGSEVGLGFLTGEHARWLEALRPLIGSAGAAA